VVEFFGAGRFYFRSLEGVTVQTESVCAFDSRVFLRFAL
jgi:hypothetical protein